MIAVIFEVWPKPEHQQEYLDLAAELKPILETIDGFISVERFESLTEKGKILSLSFLRDEAAVRPGAMCRSIASTQAKGRAKIFAELSAAYRRRDPRLRHERSRAGAEGQPRRARRALALAAARPISARPTTGREHAGNDCRQARDIPEDAREPAASSCPTRRRRQREGAAASRLQGARFDQRGLCLDHRQGRQPRHARGGLRASRRDLSAAVDLPVNADFEGGFALEPDKVARQCRARGQAPALPACRSRIPPATRHKPLYERALAVERIKAARAAIDADNSGVLLAGRCEGFLVGHDRSQAW